MTRLLLLSFPYLASIAAIPIGAESTPAAGQQPRAVPQQYVGSWVCQTTRPGYNLLLPSSDPSQPLTNKATTAATVVVQKLALKGDGTYEADSGSGHYAYDPAAKSITWLDGPHRGALTKTEVGTRRSDGAPSISFVLKQSYYGCFQPKRP
ncbi:MAG TPA: hypothetical protein VKB50_07940 [Vicinamibacterales bacterium]|nr:hypothetical protein [Vicinamibacterales bacterium]